MANVTASMENVAKTTLWQSNESSYLKLNVLKIQFAYKQTKFTTYSNVKLTEREQELKLNKYNLF